MCELVELDVLHLVVNPQVHTVRIHRHPVGTCHDSQRRAVTKTQTQIIDRNRHRYKHRYKDTSNPDTDTDTKTQRRRYRYNRRYKHTDTDKDTTTQRRKDAETNTKTPDAHHCADTCSKQIVFPVESTATDPSDVVEVLSRVDHNPLLLAVVRTVHVVLAVVMQLPQPAPLTHEK